MSNIIINSSRTTRTKKSYLAMDHVFLIAMNIFDAANQDHKMDFYLSTNLLTTSLELQDKEWERILFHIGSALEDLHKLKITSVAVACRMLDNSLKLTFSDPSYHDLHLAEVLIKKADSINGQAA